VRLTPLAFTEKNQLEAEPFAVPGRHIARVIPPFGAKIWMLEVIPGKLVQIARQGLAILETRRGKRKYAEQ